MWSSALEAAAIKSVETAEDLLQQTKVQYQVGVVSKVRVTEAEAGLAQRDFDQILRSNEASAAQDRLLTVILAPGISDYASTVIRTEEPTFVPYDVNAETALEKARAQRPELVAAQLAVKNAEYDASYAWNQKLPDLNVTASYVNAGLAGDQKNPTGTYLGNTVSGHGSALAVARQLSIWRSSGSSQAGRFMSATMSPPAGRQAYRCAF